ncbi:peptidoglycan DD-metalloendopeptidase family protein [Desulfuromonas sp.]|uniref:M23 family metallopeptidase n=1 Tax=Desulfuromonas sp. TaxID=892 RepID=UPI0025BC2197|nr:peptidoglycan DD-metalloendopeptidase family protein [Desulfuromonas sp.]
MNFDFNPPSKSAAKARLVRWRIPLAAAVLILACVTPLLFDRPSPPATEAGTVPLTMEPAAPPAPEIRREAIEGTINPGDTLTALLGGYLTPQELHDLNQKSRKIFPLTGICAGQPYTLCLEDGAFDRFEYDIDREDQLIISNEGEDLSVSRIPIEYSVETELVGATIDTSLFEAVAETGENAELAMALADIFAWDVDFIRDIRKGDSFLALVEKRFREGEPAGYGQVLAAQFTNQGTPFKAFLFKDGDRPVSYYDEQGRSLRKAFLKAPLSYSRISSGFTLRRFHPITKTWKAHPAIDYAASPGTPIKTVGDGTIIKIGYTKYNGNFVKVRHNNSFETLYLHMKGFAKGMRKGKKVRQGQTIGYVGSTGLATGPHLCFRMYKNGSPVNPNRVKMAAAPPISKEHMAEFKTAITPLLARLEGREEDTRVAASMASGPGKLELSD